MITVVSVNRRGKPQLIGMRHGEPVMSGFRKIPVGPKLVRVGKLGLFGDIQVDREVHGGPEQALYAYPFEHLIEWGGWAGTRGLLDEDGQPLKFRAGFLGENLTLLGALEHEVRIGDRYAVKTARGTWRALLLEVTKPRRPCYKLHMCYNGASAHMVRCRLCGWYFKVLQTGRIQAGDTLRLVERDNDAPTVDDVFLKKMEDSDFKIPGM